MFWTILRGKRVIDGVQVSDVDEEDTAVLSTQVRDDFAVETINAEIFPPGYQPSDAEPGETPIIDVPIVNLMPAGNNRYGNAIADLTLLGTYRLVVYAQDDEGKMTVPYAISLQNGHNVYLPTITKP